MTVLEDVKNVHWAFDSVAENKNNIEDCRNRNRIMILTTTDNIPGYSIDKFKGLVNANQVIGVDVISEFMA